MIDHGLARGCCELLFGSSPLRSWLRRGARCGASAQNCGSMLGEFSLFEGSLGSWNERLRVRERARGARMVCSRVRPPPTVEVPSTQRRCRSTGASSPGLGRGAPMRAPRARRVSPPLLGTATIDTVEPPADSNEGPACRRCGGRALTVLEPVAASACVPFPELRGVRCTTCGAEGTRVILRGREVVTWGAPIKR